MATEYYSSETIKRIIEEKRDDIKRLYDEIDTLSVINISKSINPHYRFSSINSEKSYYYDEISEIQDEINELSVRLHRVIKQEQTNKLSNERVAELINREINKLDKEIQKLIKERDEQIEYKKKEEMKYCEGGRYTGYISDAEDAEYNYEIDKLEEEILTLKTQLDQL